MNHDLLVLLERYLATKRTRAMPEEEFRARSSALGRVLSELLSIETAPVALEVLALVLGRAARLNANATTLDNVLRAVTHHYQDAPEAAPSILATPRTGRVS